MLDEKKIVEFKSFLFLASYFYAGFNMQQVHY